MSAGWIRPGQILAIALLCLVMSACVAAPAASTGEAVAPAAESAGEQVLTIAISGDVETLDSDFSHFQRSNEVNYNTQDQFFLYGSTDSGEGYSMYNPADIQGSAIESWEVADDGLSATLKIREGTKFNHSGNPVTADDFVYWYERGVETKSGYWWNIDNADITGFEKIDDSTFTINFSRPSPFFFYLFRDQSQAPVDSVRMQENATAEDPWSTQWKAVNEAASGEFYVESYEPGVQMVLRANPDYWAGKAFFDQVVLRIIPSSADRALLLQEGAVDIARDLSPTELGNLSNAPGVKVLSVPTRNQYIVGLNNTIAPFDNPLVRQALNYAVPYEQIANDVFGGNALIPGGPVARMGNGFAEGLWPYSFDLDQARALLEEAGMGDGFEMTLSVATGDPVIEELAILLRSTFSQIGVDVTIDQQTAAIFAEGLDAKTHQAWLRDLLWYVDDAAYTGFAFYTCNNPINWMAYCNPEVDEVVNEAAGIYKPEDMERKNELTTEMQRLIIEDAPVLVLSEIDLQLAMRDNIQGYLHLPDNLLWYYPLSRSE